MAVGRRLAPKSARKLPGRCCLQSKIRLAHAPLSLPAIPYLFTLCRSHDGSLWPIVPGWVGARTHSQEEDSP